MGTREPDRNTARRRETRARIVEAAMDQFGRNGIDATSVEQLCEAAGFSRGAFYSNFDSKDDVCEEVARYVATECVQACHEILGSASIGTDIVELLGRLFGVAAFSEERHNAIIELQIRARRDPALAQRLEAVRSDQWPLMLEAAERGATLAGLRFTVGVEESLRILEALYFSPIRAGDNTSLVTAAAAALLTRIEP